MTDTDIAAESRWPEVSPLSGVVFVLVYVVGVLLIALYEYLPEPAEIAATLEVDLSRIVAGATIASASVFFLLWFMGSLRAFLLAHEGGDRRLSSIAFAGGVASGFMVLMSSVAMLVVAQRAGQDGGIDPNIGALGYDLYATIGGNGMPITMAAMIAATGIVSVRTQALPRWFGWLSGALAIGLLTPVNWVLVALVLPWIAVTSVWIYLKARGTQAGGLIGGTASLVEGCLDQRGSPPV